MLRGVPAIEERALDHVPVALKPCPYEFLGPGLVEIRDVIRAEIVIIAELRRDEDPVFPDLLARERIGEILPDQLPSERIGRDVTLSHPLMSWAAWIAGRMKLAGYA